MIGFIQQALEEKQEPKQIPASLFTSNGMKGLDGLSFDLLVSESHGLDFKVSEHPVEGNLSVIDHVSQEPRVCTVTGIFTSHPIGNFSEEEREIKGIKAIENNPALEKYLKLEKIAKEKKPVRLITDIFDYKQMIITSISTNREKSSGEMIRFSMSLVEFRTVDVSQVTIEGMIQPEDMSTDERKVVAGEVNNGRVSGYTQEEDKIAENLVKIKGVL